MGLKLLPASYSDMPGLVQVLYSANSDPHDPFVDLCLPGIGAWSTSTVEEGMEEVRKNYLADWQASKTQHWMKVVDEETGQIVRYVSRA